MSLIKTALQRSPMTTYFKSQNSMSCQFTPKRASKSQKVKFYCGNVTKCIPCVVYLEYFIRLHIIDYNGTTLKPHDHLFQLSGQLGDASLPPQKLSKSKKSDILSLQCTHMHFMCGILYILYSFTYH